MDSSGIIDQATIDILLDSVGGDKEFLAELMQDFFVDAPGQISNMKEAFINKDADSFRRAAHSMKSNAASFGALHLSELCKELDKIGKSGDITSVEIKVAEVEKQYQLVKTTLQEILSF